MKIWAGDRDTQRAPWHHFLLWTSPGRSWDWSLSLRGAAHHHDVEANTHTRHATQRVRQRRTLQSQVSFCLSVTYHPRYHRLPPRIPPADIQYNVDDSIKAQPLREKRPESNHGSKIPPRLPGIHRCRRGKNIDGWCSKIQDFFILFLYLYRHLIDH